MEAMRGELADVGDTVGSGWLCVAMTLPRNSEFTGRSFKPMDTSTVRSGPAVEALNALNFCWRNYLDNATYILIPSELQPPSCLL